MAKPAIPPGLHLLDRNEQPQSGSPSPRPSCGPADVQWSTLKPVTIRGAQICPRDRYPEATKPVCHFVGGVLSPLLANVLLHYSFDAWIHQWRTRHARGQSVVIRYADDAIVGAQYESDTQRVLDALRERLAKFGLALNEDKTRLIEFGRFAAQRRAQAGLRRPETFNFLGCTHYGGMTRSGKFMVKRKTQATRMARKLQELRAEPRRRWHAKVPEQHAWLSQVVRGHYRYYGVIFNARALSQVYRLVKRMWLKALQRRSQKSKMNWKQFDRVQSVFPLPRPMIHQAWHGAAG